MLLITELLTLLNNFRKTRARANFSAHSNIRIAEACGSFKAANRESFPYIMHIVDEPRKFSPSNVLTYTVVCNHLERQKTCTYVVTT